MSANLLNNPLNRPIAQSEQLTPPDVADGAIYTRAATWHKEMCKCRFLDRSHPSAACFAPPAKQTLSHVCMDVWGGGACMMNVFAICCLFVDFVASPTTTEALHPLQQLESNKPPQGRCKLGGEKGGAAAEI